MASNAGLKVFVRLIQEAGLQDIFKCPGPFTAWIPTDAAFAALGNDLLMRLLDPNNRQLLKEVLLYHLVPGYIPTANFMAGPLTTISTKPVQVFLGPLKINDSNVVRPDIQSCNGIIDVIDKVLLPFSKWLQSRVLNRVVPAAR